MRTRWGTIASVCLVHATSLFAQQGVIREYAALARKPLFDASLFQDTDGSVHYVWQDGLIRKINGVNRSDGTYDMMYSCAKSLLGSHIPRRVAAPHAGHASHLRYRDRRTFRHAVPTGPDRQIAGAEASLGPTGRAFHRRRRSQCHAPVPAVPWRLEAAGSGPIFQTMI